MSKRHTIHTTITDGRFRQLTAFAIRHSLPYGHVISIALRCYFDLLCGKKPRLLDFAVHDSDSENLEQVRSQKIRVQKVASDNY